MWRIRILITLALIASMTSCADEIPQDVKNKIKISSAELYPDSAYMQEIMFDESIEAYKYMQNWNSQKGIPQEVFDGIKNQQLELYPDNYYMQQLAIEMQIEAYNLIQNWKAEEEVPQNIFDDIKIYQSNEFKYNYAFQKIMVQNEIESYKKMQEWNSGKDIPPKVFAELKQGAREFSPSSHSAQLRVFKICLEKYLEDKENDLKVPQSQ